MKTSPFFFLFVVISFSVIGQKSPTSAADFKCQQTAKITKQWFGTLGVVIEYANKKISKIYRADGKGLVENYSYQNDTTLLITRNFSDGSVGNIFNVALNKKGYFLQFTQVDEKFGYTVVNAYDEAGFLLTSHSRFQNDAKLNSHSAYSYLDGNLIQAKNFQNDTLSYTADYTYYKDKINQADLIGNQNRPDMNGKFSKNLVQSLRYTYADKTVDLYEYTYLMANGFVKSATEKHTDAKGKITSQVNKFEYVCL